MRRSATFVLWGVLGMGTITAATAAPAAVRQNGWLIYGDSHASQTLPCAPTPILLTGSHTDTAVKGACAYVRVSGDHNDVAVDIAAGGTIEITGMHNDVTWRQVTQGPPPRLINARASNTFHHGDS